SSFSATNCPASSGACNLTVTEIAASNVTAASGLFANTTVAPIVIGTGGRIAPNTIIDNDTAGSVEVSARTAYDPVQDGIDFYESLEGMLVQVNNARVVGPTNRFGEIWVVGDNGSNASGANMRGGLTLIETGGSVDFNPERIQVDVSLLTSVYPQVNVGDSAPLVVGVLSYDFGNFRVFPASLPQFASSALARTT